MPEYDFKQLSPYEFEQISRDLIQTCLGIRLESFKIGRDNGIDFRYAPSAKEKLIVQCKHYVRTGLSGLFRDIRKEKIKIDSLNSTRYILTTSVALSPGNKDDICRIIPGTFSTDIWGQDDLNNLLSLHPEVERSHFKLWLASKAVLDRVIHNAVVTQSEFATDKVYESIKKYVQSLSYSKALDILQKQRIVVIAGSPGVGKTTLANMILYYFLQQDYEAVIIKRDVHEGQQVVQRGKRQIFYFDDFMGATFLGDNTGFKHSGDKALIDFVSLVRSSNTSLLILTTREHILNSALIQSERLRHSDLLDFKTVLTIKDYDLRDKAKILYNHLYFSDLPLPYISHLLKDRFYLQIIKHKKFNPRLIEWLSTYRRFRHVSCERYVEFVSKLLEDPSEIWVHAYDNELGNGARSLMMTIYTMGGKCEERWLELAFNRLHRERSRHYNFQTRPNDFDEAFRELVGSFLRMEADVAEFVDPSVMDLMNHLSIKSPDNLVQLLKGCEYARQTAQVWKIIRSADNWRVACAIRENGFAIAEGLESAFENGHRVEALPGSRMPDISLSKRIALYVEICNEIKHPLLITLIEKCCSHLFEQCLHKQLIIEDAILAVTALKQSSWDKIKVLESSYLGLRKIIFKRAAEGCLLSEIKQIISCYEIDLEEDDPETRSLWEGFEGYRYNMLADLLRECQTEEQLDEFSEELEEVASLFGVSVYDDRKRIAEMAKSLAPDDDSDDSFYERWREGRHSADLDEKAVCEMFESLSQVISQ